MKTQAMYVLLVIPLFTSGCFTAMRHYGEAWSGGSSKSDVAKTTALDIATFPIQAPVVVPGYAIAKANESAARQRAKEEADANKNLMPLLVINPARGLKERWDLKKGMHRWILIKSFSNPKIKYTDDLLEEIHQTCPSIRDCVFSSPSCSKEFLARHYDEEFKRAKNPAYQSGLETIVSNPNTPLDLVEKVTTTPGFAGGMTLSAQYALGQRRWERLMPSLQSDPTLALRERWDTNYPKWIAFEKSFAYPQINYSEELLETIYQTCPSVRAGVFTSPVCSKEFFVKHFDEQFANVRKFQFKGMENLIANPNTPIELVEKVASPQSYHYQVASGQQSLIKQAQEILEERRSKQAAQPATQ